MKKEKKLEYYKNLRYSIEIIAIPEKYGGGYEANIPQLGKHSFCGSGDTIEEALNKLEEVKILLFAEHIEEGISIPLPEKEEPGIFNGKLTIKVDKQLHYKLAMDAKSKNINFSHHVSNLFEQWAIRCGYFSSNIETLKTADMKEYRDIYVYPLAS